MSSLAAQKTLLQSKLVNSTLSDRDHSLTRFRIEILARKRRRLDDEHDALEKEYYDGALLNAQRQCLSFAKAFTNKLPLELRDLGTSTIPSWYH
jgi:hypothetical protein